MRRLPGLQVLPVLALLACAKAPPPTPPYVAKVLANRVILSSPKPLLSLRLFFLAGSIQDPPGKEGLTALTAELMVQGGTERLSAAEFQSELFPLAAEISVDSGVETTVFVGRVHRDLIERFLPLFTDALAHPRFEQRELERLRADALDDLTIRLRHNDDEQLGKEALQALIYDGHPFGFPTLGTAAGLRSITLDDIKNQWRRVFARDRLTIGLIGSEASPELADRIAQALSSLNPSGPPLPAPLSPVDDGIKALLVQKTTDTTALSLGYSYDVHRDAPDFYPLWVGNSAIGEHRQLGGLLFRQLRERRGLNYGDYTYLEDFVEGEGTYPQPNQDRRQQYFSVWLRPVQNRNAGFALRAALFEIGRVVREGLSLAQVERAKAFLKTYTLAWEASDGRKLGYALDDAFYGTPAFLESFRQRLPGITAEQVNAALRAHVVPSKLRFAVVLQDAVGFRNALLTGRPTPIHYDGARPAELLADDARIEGLGLGLTEANTRVMTSDQLFERRSLSQGPLVAGGKSR